MLARNIRPRSRRGHEAVVVRERPADPWASANRLQRSSLNVRHGVGIHPKGVFRFKTHEELHESTRKQKVLAATDLAVRRSTA